MNRIITYGIEPDGTVISRVDGEVAFPVLDFEAIGQGGDGFTPGDFNGPTRYALEKFSVYYPGLYPSIRWTKKISIGIKNLHREFWGFKPLEADDSYEQYISAGAPGSYRQWLSTRSAS